MSPAPTPVPESHGELWPGRYEHVRSLAVTGSTGGGWGLALLCRRGLVAWMRSWPRGDDDGIARHEGDRRADDPVGDAVEPSMREQLVVLVAGMILGSERRQTA